MGRIEILHCSGLAAAHRGVLRSLGVGGPLLCPRLDSEQFRSAPRTSQPCCGSLTVPHRLLSLGGLTMSERFVDEGQESWASDIIGIVSGVGLYSVLFFLVTFLCLYLPA